MRHDEVWTIALFVAVALAGCENAAKVGDETPELSVDGGSGDVAIEKQNEGDASGSNGCASDESPARLGGGPVRCLKNCRNVSDCEEKEVCKEEVCVPESFYGNDGQGGPDTSGSSDPGDLAISVVNLDVTRLEDSGGVVPPGDCGFEPGSSRDCCKYDYQVRMAAFSRQTQKACQVAGRLGEFSPGGETKGFLATFEIRDHAASCAKLREKEQFTCPAGERFEFEGDWDDEYGFTDEDAWFSVWDENGEEVEHHDAEVGHIEFSGNCRVDALVKYHGEPVQQEYSFAVQGPWPTEELVCSKN